MKVLMLRIVSVHFDVLQASSMNETKRGERIHITSLLPHRWGRQLDTASDPWYNGRGCRVTLGMLLEWHLAWH